MKETWNKAISKLKNPPTYVKIITALVTLISIALSFVLLFTSDEPNFLAYIAFSVAGVSFAYCVFLIIPLFPRFKRKISAFMHRHDFTYLLMKNFGFRTVILTIGSFIIGLIFSGFNAFMGISSRSVWYGALAGYYLSLTLLRGGILIHHAKKVGKNRRGNEEEQTLLYRNSGIVMLVLNVALSVAIAEMIFSNAHFYFYGWSVIGYATYAFYKITASIISFIRAHKQNDLTIRAIRNVNLADSLVCILALQTALLSAFSNGALSVSLMNTLTGSAVSLFSIAIGIYMIISANKLKKVKKEEKR